MIQYKVRWGQTIYDVATQHYGITQGVSQLLANNPGMTINTVLTPGDLVWIDETKSLDTARTSYIQDKQIVISNYTENEAADDSNYWITELNEYVITEQGDKIRV